MDSIELMEKVMGFVRREAWMASVRLGAEKGTFPEFEPNREAYTKFLREEIGIPENVAITPRNYEVTTIAPTICPLGFVSLAAMTPLPPRPLRGKCWSFVRLP